MTEEAFIDLVLWFDCVVLDDIDTYYVCQLYDRSTCILQLAKSYVKQTNPITLFDMIADALKRASSPSLLQRMKRLLQPTR